MVFRAGENTFVMAVTEAVACLNDAHAAELAPLVQRLAATYTKLREGLAKRGAAREG